MRLRNHLAVLLLALSVLGCARQQQSIPAAVPPPPAGDSQLFVASRQWVEVQLYFGLGPADHPEQGVSESDWRAFLDREVTPRFPSGFSAIDVYGQWQGHKEAPIERLRSKMLIVVCADTGENRAGIDAIRTAWKQKTGDQSVLRVIGPADVSF